MTDTTPEFKNTYTVHTDLYGEITIQADSYEAQGDWAIFYRDASRQLSETTTVTTGIWPFRKQSVATEIVDLRSRRRVECIRGKHIWRIASTPNTASDPLE